MKRTRFTPRVLALLVALTIGLPPPPAFALRGQQQEDPSQLAGLEEALKDPAKVLHRLAQLITPAPSQATGTSFPTVRSEQPFAIKRTGLEEQFRTELADKMRNNDVLSVKELTAWAEGTFGKNQKELFGAVRELGPTLTEGKGWRSFLQVVTENGQQTDELKVFAAIHRDRDGDWHRGVAVLFVAPDGRLILQRRASFWGYEDRRLDLSVGGHVLPGQSLEEAAVEMARREVGFSLDTHRLRGIGPNPVKDSGELFRKIGERGFDEPPKYSGGIFYSDSKESGNKEIDTLYLYLLTEEELKDLQGRSRKADEAWGYQHVAIDEIIQNVQSLAQGSPPKLYEEYASGILQYFSDPLVTNHIRQELARLTAPPQEVLDQLKELERLERLIEQDPLEGLRARPPLKAIFADFDSTMAPSGDADTDRETDALLREFLRGGGFFGIITARSKKTVEDRIRLESIYRGLPDETRERFSVFERLGASALIQEIEAKGNKRLTLDHVVKIAQAIGGKHGLNISWKPVLRKAADRPKPEKNPDMDLYDLGMVSIWVLKGVPPEEAFFAVLSFEDKEQRLQRKEYVDFIKDHPEFKSWVDATVSGRGSVNLGLVNKSELVRKMIGRLGLRSEEVAVMGDEGDRYGGDYGMLTLPGVWAILAGHKEDDLPDTVLRSEREGPATFRRLLQIESVKRQPGKTLFSLLEGEVRRLFEMAGSQDSRVRQKANQVIAEMVKADLENGLTREATLAEFPEHPKNELIVSIPISAGSPSPNVPPTVRNFLVVERQKQSGHPTAEGFLTDLLNNWRPGSAHWTLLLIHRDGIVRAVRSLDDPVMDYQELKVLIHPLAGLEERIPAWLDSALGADWMEAVAGVHEMAKVTDKVAVLLQPELLGVAEGDSETEVALMSLEGNLRGAFGWSEQTPLRLGLLTPQSVEALEGKGYRVIRVVRHPESEETPLPWEAVPVVVAEALAGGRPTFRVNVTPYLNLRGITLPEILTTLTDLFA